MRFVAFPPIHNVYNSQENRLIKGYVTEVTDFRYGYYNQKSKWKPYLKRHWPVIFSALLSILCRPTFIIIFLKLLVFRLKRLNIQTHPTMQTVVTKGVKTAPSNRLKFRLTTKLPLLLLLNNLNTKHTSPSRLFPEKSFAVTYSC